MQKTLTQFSRTVSFKTKSARSIVDKVAGRFQEGGLSAAAAEVRGSLARLTKWYSPVRVWRRTRRSDFDRKYHVDTSGIVHPAALGGSGLESTQYYKAIVDDGLDESMARLPVDPRRFVFLDYGSGKGKVLFLAARHPFKRIVGVELDRKLHDITLANFKTFRDPAQVCFDLHSECADATTYDLPDEPCVLFLFNPFGYSIMAKVLDHVAESKRANPREIWMIYKNPRCHAEVSARPDMRTEYHSPQVALYEMI